MGGKSKTQQSSTVNQDTNSLFLQDFEGVGIANSDNVQLTTLNQNVDPGARAIIGDGLNSVSAIASNAFDTSQSIASDANNLAGQAIALQQGSLDSSLDFASDTLDDSFIFGGDVFESATRAVERSGDNVATLATRVVDSSGNFLRDGFGFGVNALDAIDNAGQRQSNVVDDAFNFVGGLFNNAINAVTDTNQRATATLSGAIGSAADATRSDSADVLNNIVKFGAIGVGVVAVGFFLTRGK